MKLNRRSFIKSVGACTAGIGVAATVSPVQPEALGSPNVNDSDDAPVLQIGDHIAVAETTNGPVRGFILNGIVTFRGIPYGADTSGVNRFMPPRKPARWSEIKPTIWWGNSAPRT